MAEDIEKRVGQYVAIRDKIKELNEAHAAKIKPLSDLQEVLAGRLEQFLTASNTDSLRTKQGTCYKTTRYNASLADPQAFMDYVTKTARYDLLDRRANTSAVKEFVEQEKHLPPGCNLSGITTVGVRRPTGKKSELPDGNNENPPAE